MIILELADFKNYHFLAHSNENDVVIQSYIDRHEESFIKKILGVELGQLFIDDIQGVDSDSSAIETRFQIILDAFIKQPLSCIHESKGMRDVLASLVMYEYIMDTVAKHSQSGVVQPQAETSGVYSGAQQSTFAENKFNEAMISIWAIQWWVGVEDHDNYPEYKGITFSVINPIL